MLFPEPPVCLALPALSGSEEESSCSPRRNSQTYPIIGKLLMAAMPKRNWPFVPLPLFVRLFDYGCPSGNVNGGNEYMHTHSFVDKVFSVLYC